MLQPRLIDLYSCDGTGADGYADAGFFVTGVDIVNRQHYPFDFFQADALDVLRGWQPGVYDAIHASPPCQLFTRAKHLREAQGHQTKETTDLLTPTLATLRSMDVPWVVENVEAAKPLMQPGPGEYLARVCGSSFGLDVQRHRLFLSNVPLRGTECHHDRFPLDPESGRPRPWGVYHVPGDSIPQGGRTAVNAWHAAALFGLSRDLPWDSIKEGFPPAYTRYIGFQLRAHLELAA